MERDYNTTQDRKQKLITRYQHYYSSCQDIPATSSFSLAIFYFQGILLSSSCQGPALYKILSPLHSRMLLLGILLLLCRVNYFHFLNTSSQDGLQLSQIKMLIKVFSSTKATVPKLHTEAPQDTAANSQECYWIFYLRVICTISTLDCNKFLWADVLFRNF